MVLHDVISEIYLPLTGLWLLWLLLRLCLCHPFLLSGSSLSSTPSIRNKCNCIEISGPSLTTYLSKGLWGSALSELFELSGVVALFLLDLRRCFMPTVLGDSIVNSLFSGALLTSLPCFWWRTGWVTSSMSFCNTQFNRSTYFIWLSTRSKILSTTAPTLRRSSFFIWLFNRNLGRGVSSVSVSQTNFMSLMARAHPSNNSWSRFLWKWICGDNPDTWEPNHLTNPVNRPPSLWRSVDKWGVFHDQSK